MKDKKLKLLSNPNSNARYPNIELLDLKPPVRRFIGWNMVTVQVDGQSRFGFERKTEPDVVPYHRDYVLAVKQGDLIAADLETAQLCGVSFKK